MHFLYYFLLHFLCAFFITPTVFTWLRKIPQKLTSRRYFRPVALFVEPLPTVGGFEALGGVDDAAECRHAVDSDILEFVTVAVVRRLMGHARIERIAQCRILLRDVPAMHAHLAPGGGMPPSAAPSATFVAFAESVPSRTNRNHSINQISTHSFKLISFSQRTCPQLFPGVSVRKPVSAHTRPAILIRRKLCDERPMRIRVVRPLVGLPRLVDADRLPGAGNVNANTSKIRYVFSWRDYIKDCGCGSCDTGKKKELVRQSARTSSMVLRTVWSLISSSPLSWRRPFSQEPSSPLPSWREPSSRRLSSQEP